jgi:hypothetical protein
MFESFLEHRRGGSLRRLPRGALSAVGAGLVVVGLVLHAIVELRLSSPPAGAFIDLEGALLWGVFGVVAMALVVVGAVVAATDLVLLATSRRRVDDQ